MKLKNHAFEWKIYLLLSGATPTPADTALIAGSLMRMHSFTKIMLFNNNSNQSPAYMQPFTSWHTTYYNMD